VEKTKVMRISWESSPLRIMIEQKLENEEYFNYLCSIITNDERCTCEIKSTIVMAKTAFSRKNTLFHQQIGPKLKEDTSNVLRLQHSIVWC
jgi:hypothetical protein